MAEYERLIYTNERGESIEFSASSSFFVNVANDVTGISDIRNTRIPVALWGNMEKPI